MPIITHTELEQKLQMRVNLLQTNIEVMTEKLIALETAHAQRVAAYGQSIAVLRAQLDKDDWK
jgi:hypothetical protein